ncbi:MarR family transcriptional regulator [Myxococcus sp. CA051A]|uniref:MarR family transcriptional regulator n=2 Tax=Myxococcus TaxID=32 RepID=A0A540WVD4_9BACT|nr:MULTISPECIES: MarR family transcriptional regulator [Myxococcus]NTX07963.1 MarR family transcriptional regulator [Myxococcus sp. CA040A]NTX14808.1 MarR family transcriptional regulator [Myxococcus sp. CA056]NTX40621.1 MarR family transcriptional regulator [Myxococcus sp. CA033]NTX55095.1 MarR family transcriptional regulator [Myxococcus sp. CA039A]NTX66642.1 MarR family transcriptional regulator [Myxococcus sp. CA051A]
MVRTKKGAKKATPSPLKCTPAQRELGASLLQKLMSFNRARAVLRDPISQLCQEEDLSSPQFHVILWLGYDGPLHTGELSRLADINDKSITGVVDRLEHRGLVARTRHPDDRRTVVNTLTAAGRALYAEIANRIETGLGFFIGTMDPLEQEITFRLADRLLTLMSSGSK